MALWNSSTCAPWHAAADAYPAALAARPGSGLPALDAWYQHEWPGGLAARTPAYITVDELVRVTSWKMQRGVWRARNRALVAGNAPATVEETSRAAFAAIPDPRRPLTLLSTLAGVGPATASAVLAALRPDLYPFFDEQVAAQIPALGPVAFTLPYYIRYAAALRAEAVRLTGICPHQPWTAHALSQALWSASQV